MLIGYAALVALTTIGGCGGTGGSAAPGVIATRLQVASQRAESMHNAGSLHRVLFVSDLAGAVVYFTANIRAKNPPTLGRITQGVTRARGLWVDRHGTLYVSNDTSPAGVVEYKRGTSSPLKTITSGLYAPGAVAVGSSGLLYVVDRSLGDIIQEYPPGSNTPGKTVQIPHKGRSAMGGLAFDPRGDLLVATFDVKHGYGSVYRIALGSSHPVNLNLVGTPGSALGADRAGNIYVGGVEGDIAVYAPGSTTPSRFVNAGTNGFDGDFAVTPDGTIYWPNDDLGEMFEFAPGAPSPTNVFAGGGVDAAVGSR